MSVKLLLAVLMVLPLCSVCEEYSATVSNHGGISAFKSKNPTHVAVVTAKWCSDTMKNMDKIDSIRAAAKKNGWSILNSDVGDKTQFTNAKNYMRVDPLYKVTGLPSIYLVQKGKIAKTISNQQIYDQGLVDAFIKALGTKPKMSPRAEQA